MIDHRLTLRITRATDVPRAVAEIQGALAEREISNPALMNLLVETGQRFQRDILGGPVHTPNSGPVSSLNNEGGKQAVGETIMRGEGYSVRITTREETFVERLTDVLLRRPAAFH